jgi:hypothetical protein
MPYSFFDRFSALERKWKWNLQMTAFKRLSKSFTTSKGFFANPRLRGIATNSSEIGAQVISILETAYVLTNLYLPLYLEKIQEVKKSWKISGSCAKSKK